jgi:molybdopterin molybdotransferase
MSLRSYQIRNSNAVMLTALLERMGAEPGTVVHVPDDPDASHAALRDALQHHDLVITVGGVSAGDRDHFPRVMDQLGIIRTANGASIQPGKPIIVGYGTNTAHTIVVGLPGNPVSALACACLFIWPILRSLVQTNDPLPWRSVTLAEEVKPNAHRQVFRPAIVQPDGSAVVPSWAGSGDLTHTAPTHGLIELPRQSSHVCSGSVLRFLPWP